MEPSTDGTSIDERLASIELQVIETHDMVKNLRRLQRINFALRAGYWLILIAIGVISYGAIQPYIEKLSDFYGLPFNR